MTIPSWTPGRGTPSPVVYWPSRVPGTVLTSAPTNQVGDLAVSGRIRGVLITDWVVPIGAKLNIYQLDGVTLIHTFVFRFAAAPDTPHLVAFTPDSVAGLSMGRAWSYSLSSLSGQFDAILLWDEGA